MYKITAKYIITDVEGIVKVYFINDTPFTYDVVDESIKEDEKVIQEAVHLPSLSIKDITTKSAYLLEEGLHPLLSGIELHPDSVLPDMLQ
jgi:hypothetical protein